MGADLLNIIETIRSAQDRLRQHKEIMGNLWEGADYTNIELQYGVPTGKGDDLLLLVNSSVNYLTNSGLSLLADYQYAATSFNNMIDQVIPVV